MTTMEREPSTDEYPPFSVLISTYAGDDPDGLARALDSVIDQTVPPAEVVIVTDGPIPDDLEAVVNRFRDEHPTVAVCVELPTNQGLGVALKRGVEACSHDLVARMDADDVSVPERFETQLRYLKQKPFVDVVGGFIGEFSEDPERIETVREVPLSDEGVRSMARFRSPVNHPSVMFRRQAVLDVGNYRPLRSMQDYDLWMRLLAADYTITNLSTILVHCEAGTDLFERRGGYAYAKLETKLQYQFLRMGMISVPVFFLNILVRIPIRLAPNGVRSFVYRTALRD